MNPAHKIDGGTPINIEWMCMYESLRAQGTLTIGSLLSSYLGLCGVVRSCDDRQLSLTPATGF